MAIKLVIFDLDGTLLDVSERYFKSISDSLREVGVSSPQKSKIIELKRRGLSGKGILDRLIPDTVIDKAGMIELCEKKRVERMNSASYHELDKPFQKTKFVLKELRRRGMKIAILTARPSEEMTREQLRNLGMVDLVDDISAMRGEDVSGIKLSLGKDLCKRFGLKPSECCMVGDSIHELNAGRELGTMTIGVSYGFGGKDALAEKSPANIIDSIEDILKLI